MKVTVMLFAAARELAGTDTLELDVPPGATIAVLRGEMSRQVPRLAPLVAGSLFALGSDYANDSAAIAPGDEIALIPPVSGG